MAAGSADEFWNKTFDFCQTGELGQGHAEGSEDCLGTEPRAG